MNPEITLADAQQQQSNIEFEQLKYVLQNYEQQKKDGLITWEFEDGKAVIKIAPVDRLQNEPLIYKFSKTQVERLGAKFDEKILEAKGKLLQMEEAVRNQKEFIEQIYSEKQSIIGLIEEDVKRTIEDSLSPKNKPKK